jgi:hypothetical protein
MHKPMKWSDSDSGHNHEIPNSVFEIQVDSTQAENSGIVRRPLHFT